MPDTDKKSTGNPVPEEAKQEQPRETASHEHKEHAEPENRKKKKVSAELAELETQNEALSKELSETKDSLVRLAAEFDNYKKRTAKEREGIYSESVAATIATLLPVLDNLERAAGADGEKEALKKGVEMTLKQMTDAMSKLNVSEIEVKAGDPLDPTIHNAMMQIEDDTLPPNCVAEVLMKGYKIGDKVIRYTMVKSAN